MSVIDHLAVILNSAGIGVWHLHVPSGKVIRNQVLLRLSNASSQDLDRDQWAWTEQVHPADRARVVEKAQQILTGRLDSYDVDYRVRNGCGEWVSVRAQAAVTERDAAGQPVWLSSLLIDISRERAAERRLHAISDRPFQFDGLLSADGITLKTGPRSEELIGRPLWESPRFAHSPALQEQIQEGVARAARGELVRFEMQVLDEKGLARTVDFTLTPLRDDDGAITSIVPEGRDITDLVVARQAQHAAEQRLHTAAEAANVGLWEWDVATDDMWFSDQSCRLLQREPGTGPNNVKIWRAIVHPDDLSRISVEIVRYLRHEAADYRIEFRMRRGDDSWAWFLSTARATDRAPDGRVKRIAGVLLDISAQHIVAQRLALATEGANIGHWDTNELTGEMWVSEQWGSMLGFGAHELPTTINAVFSLLHPEDLSRVLKSLGDFQSDGQTGSFDIEYRMRAKDGSWRWIHAKGRSVETGVDGRSTRQTGVTMDVTERKEAEARLVTSERLESLGRLAAGVAHEINTPIQYVSDSVYFIREGLKELNQYSDVRRLPASEVDLVYWQEHLPAAVERAVDGLSRVAEIVRSMNVLTHADHAEMRPVDLNRAVQSTLVVAKNEYKLVADIQTDLAEVSPIMCHGSQINQVILNMVVNAAHAIADRVADTEERGLITVRTYEDDGEAVICIADTGTGIPEAIRDRIFEPFFSTKEVGRGTGQGLSIALNVVRAHGGSITFQTQTNTGTTFFVRLPVNHAAGDNAAIVAA
jgi:two-component system, NtrC family, sensor kinase